MTKDIIATTLFGKTRRAVLGLLYSHADEAFYVREILRRLDCGQGAVQSELKQLAAAGLITKEQKGNQVYYQANKNAAVFKELKSLVVKTVGAVDVIKSALRRHETLITAAFLFGSIATGRETAKSDVDLMIVGDLSLADVVSALQKAQKTLAREINPTVYAPDEFRTKAGEKHHFITSILKEPKIFVIGGAGELRKLVEE